MPEKQTPVLLSKVMVSPEASVGDKSINRLYIDIINSEQIPVLCFNQETGKQRLMPFKVLSDTNEYFWQQGGAWKYYITAEDYNKIKENAAAKQSTWDKEKLKKEILQPALEAASANKEVKVVKDSDKSKETNVEVGYGEEFKAIAAMNKQEKLSHIEKHRQRLNELMSLKEKDVELITEALVDTAKDAALINHAALEDAMVLADDEAKKFTQEFVDSTSEMVKSSTQLMAEDIFNNELMKTIVEKSNGTIVQHMTRVYLNGIGFLSFFNNLVTTSSAIQRFRIAFDKKYRDFYHGLLPHMDREEVDLEHVFLGGMRAIPQDMFFKWAVGFLIHDIGKADAIEYHEGEDAYDRSKVIEHVKTGYKSIMTKTNYPLEASLITGYHHEYYGASDGYGYFRAYLQQYKRQNPGAKQDFVITYDLEPIMDYQALAYFPAKVLEIVDVYDSVTDPQRVYRKAMTPEEALNMMRKEFIVKTRKLDLILFDIYAMFIKQKYSIENNS